MGQSLGRPGALLGWGSNWAHVQRMPIHIRNSSIPGPSSQLELGCYSRTGRSLGRLGGRGTGWAAGVVMVKKMRPPPTTISSSLLPASSGSLVRSWGAPGIPRAPPSRNWTITAPTRAPDAPGRLQQLRRGASSMIVLGQGFLGIVSWIQQPPLEHSQWHVAFAAFEDAPQGPPAECWRQHPLEVGQLSGAVKHTA